MRSFLIVSSRSTCRSHVFYISSALFNLIPASTFLYIYISRGICLPNQQYSSYQPIVSSIESEHSYSNQSTQDFDLPIVPPPPKELSYPPSQVSTSSYGRKKLIMNGSTQSLDLQSSLVTSITLPSATPTPEFERVAPFSAQPQRKRLVTKPPHCLSSAQSNPQLKNLDALQKTHREHKKLLRRCLSEAETGPTFRSLLVNCNNNGIDRTLREREKVSTNGTSRYNRDGRPFSRGKVII